MKSHVLVLQQKGPLATLLARVVETGDTYGLHFKLVHDGPEPLIEFYDTRYPHTCYGQFIARYNLDIILNSRSGMDLQGGVPSWVATSVSMARVRAWLYDTLDINRD